MILLFMCIWFIRIILNRMDRFNDTLKICIYYEWSFQLFMEINKFEWDRFAKKQIKMIDYLKEIHNAKKL